MTKAYQSLINGIFVCGLAAVDQAMKNEAINVVVDLRAEADQAETNYGNKKIIPLVDGQPNQGKLLQEAIHLVVNAYRDNKQVILH